MKDRYGDLYESHKISDDICQLSYSLKIFRHGFRKTILALQSVAWGEGLGGGAQARPPSPHPKQLSSCQEPCLSSELITRSKTANQLARRFAVLSSRLLVQKVRRRST